MRNGFSIFRYLKCISFALIIWPFILQAQKKHVSFKDSLDGKFDVSNYIIDANGFILLPIIITESALGGFGGALVPIFLKQRPPYQDSVNGKLVSTPVQPDITGGLGLYTVNKTWGVDVFRSGTFVKSRIKYFFNVGYFNVNMSFYRTVGEAVDNEFAFNFKCMPIVLQASKRLGRSNWYAGLKYLLLDVEVNYVGNKILPPELGVPVSYDRLISTAGVLIELDNRDNIFTPNSGIKFHIDGQLSNDAIGSDYNYGRLNYYMYLYKKISRKLTGALRLDGQQSFDDAPFFLLPYIDMRGIPTMRYQGEADVLTELETRWDLGKYDRWSLMLFGGLGKAFNEWEDFGSEEWVYSYGTGFRYLLARKFGLRMGIDVAKGPPGSWGYYIVFGSSWWK